MTMSTNQRVHKASDTSGEWHRSRWHTKCNDISESLWDQCFPPSIEGRFWYESLEKCGIEKQFQFLYLVVQNADGPVALAPAFIMDVPLQVMAPAELKTTLDIVSKFAPFLTKIRTLFIGSPCADEGTIGMIPGADADMVLAEVRRAAESMAKEKSAAMIVWKDFPAHESELIGKRAHEWGLHQIPSYPGAELQLPAGDFENYLMSLKKSRRQNLKKKLTKGKEALPLTAEVITHPDDQTLDELFRLFWGTYEKGTTKFEELNIEFFKQVSKKPATRFLVLRDASGRAAAFRLFFELEGKIINKFIGLDYSITSDAFLLFRLVEEGIKYAIQRDIRIIQSGQTGYRAKFETGHKLVPLYNFIRHRNPLLHRGLVALASDITWLTVDDELAEYLKAHPDALP